jgi:hypothetical protein
MTLDWLSMIRQFLEQHPNVHFEMQIDPEGIDNDQSVCTLSLVEYGPTGTPTAFRVNVHGPTTLVFEHIEANFGVLLESAQSAFN